MPGSQNINKFGEINVYKFFDFLRKNWKLILLNILFFLGLGIWASLANLHYKSTIRVNTSSHATSFDRNHDDLIEIYGHLFESPFYADSFSESFFSQSLNEQSQLTNFIQNNFESNEDFSDFLKNKLSARLDKTYTIFSNLPLHIQILNESELLLTIITSAKNTAEYIAKTFLTALNATIIIFNTEEEQRRKAALEEFSQLKIKTNKTLLSDPDRTNYYQQALQADKVFFETQEKIASILNQNIPKETIQKGWSRKYAATNLLAKIVELHSKEKITSEEYNQIYDLLLNAQKQYLDVETVKFLEKEKMRDIQRFLATDLYGLIKNSQPKAYILYQFKNVSTDNIKFRDQIVRIDIFIYCFIGLLAGVCSSVLMIMFRSLFKNERNIYFPPQ